MVKEIVATATLLAMILVTIFFVLAPYSDKYGPTPYVTSASIFSDRKISDISTFDSINSSISLSNSR